MKKILLRHEILQNSNLNCIYARTTTYCYIHIVCFHLSALDVHLICSWLRMSVFVRICLGLQMIFWLQLCPLSFKRWNRFLLCLKQFNYHLILCFIYIIKNPSLVWSVIFWNESSVLCSMTQENFFLSNYFKSKNIE